MKRLGLLLRAGVPLLRALEMLRTQAKSASARYVYAWLCKDVAQGKMLADALLPFENIFGKVNVAVVRVGELSGTLPENAEYAAVMLQKDQALRSKVLGALVYPAVVVSTTLTIALSLTLYIFPKITPIFKSFHTALPLATRALIATSGFLLAYGWWFMIGIVFLVVVSWYAVRRFARMRIAVAHAMLRVPIFGMLARQYALAHLCRTLGLLLKSDMRVPEALGACARSSPHVCFAAVYARMATRTASGVSVATSMTCEPLVPVMLAQMVATGEETGRLHETLLYLSELYEDDIEELTRHLATLLEPFLMVTLGLIVGFIAIAIITPIYGITQNMSAVR